MRWAAPFSRAAAATQSWRRTSKAFRKYEPPMPRQVPELLMRLVEHGLPAIKTENLYRFDGQPGYSVAQGE
ncbi:MAG: hypothetical protein J0H95_10705 [Xanthomonadales bacterium]|nr:hypothetical protein [Xanthomonadales bacterium]MBN8795937.1 hypothetical protein [Stenotrophomonas nitritireducens]